MMEIDGPSNAVSVSISDPSPLAPKPSQQLKRLSPLQFQQECQH